MSKHARANTAGDTSVVTAESLLKSLASITLEAQGNLATNPNADPLGLVLLDGCEDAVDKEAYPNDTNHVEGDKYIEHSFKKTHPGFSYQLRRAIV
jgi:hypothetical protein